MSEITAVDVEEASAGASAGAAPEMEPEAQRGAGEESGDGTAEGQEDGAESAEAAPPEGDADAGAPEAGEAAQAADDAEAPETQGPGPGDELDDEELSQQMLALLFASPEPLSTGRLVRLLDRPQKQRVEALLEQLGPRLTESGLPLQITAVAGGWRLLTTADMAEVVTRLSKARKTERISPAALETLAIVAYRQPVTKAEIEAIRGVQAGAILRSLVERGLARISGRADQPGSPLQYGTTKEFLDRFGLRSLDDLPRDGELTRE